MRQLAMLQHQHLAIAAQPLYMRSPTAALICCSMHIQGPGLDEGSDDDSADSRGKKSRSSSSSKDVSTTPEGGAAAKRYRLLPDDGTPANLVKVWPAVVPPTTYIRGCLCAFACTWNQCTCQTRTVWGYSLLQQNGAYCCLMLAHLLTLTRHY